MKSNLAMKRSMSVKDDDLRSSMKTIELSVLNEPIKEENESLRDNLNESQEFSINEEDSDIQAVSGFQYYFEVILSILFLLNSFFIYSYINILHIIYCPILIRSRYNIEYNFWVKSKKCLMIFLIIIDISYIIIKTLLFVAFSCEIEHEIIQNLYAYFLIGRNWQSSYDYGFTCFTILFITIYLCVAELDEEFWKASILPKTNNILKKYALNSSKAKNVLNFAMFYITLGGSIYPSAINFFIVVIGFGFFVSLIFGKKCRNVVKKELSNLYMHILPLYTIANYIVNTPQIKSKLKGPISQLFYIDIFETDTATRDKCYLIGNFFHAGCLPFLLFMKGFNDINLHLNYLHYNDKMDMEDIYRDTNNNSFSLNHSSEKENKQLQTIFNTNLDCGFLIFAKEYSNVGIFTIINMFILKFCYTPAFYLHLCRISAILWINCYKAYASIIFIIWLFLSISCAKRTCFFLITKFIIYPILLIIFFISYFANINGTSFDSKYLGLEYYALSKHRITHLINKFLIVTVFQTYLHLRRKHSKLLNNMEVLKNIQNQQKELENAIKYDLKGKYVTKPLELFFKGYFIILDILVIITLYLAVTQTINIVNQLGLLFLISMFILNNRSFKTNGVYICLFLLTIVFIVKYVLYFMYQEEKNIDNITETEFILYMTVHDHLYNIHYYWFAYYFLFLEYASQSSHLFQICNNKTFSMHELIEQNLGSHNYIKLVSTTLTNFIFGVYIWLLIPCFVACLIMKDNNTIFSFQLLILFFIYYKYIQIANNNFSDLEQIREIFKYTWGLIFSTILNLLVVYGIQFLNKRPLSTFHSSLNFKTKTILEVTGLFIFNGQYSRHMISFFVMFILSVALHVEICRQIKINATNYEIRKCVKQYSLSFFRHKGKNKFNSSISLSNILKEKREDFSLNNKEKEIILNDSMSRISNLSNTSNSIDSKKEKEKMENTIKKRKNEKQKATQMIYRLYLVLYYILHYYWIIIFVFICGLAFHWMLSFSMALQLSLFCFYITKSFKIYYNYYNERSMAVNDNQPIKQKVKIYSEEKLERFKTTSETQQNYFKKLWFFTFVFIIASYSCSILLKIVKAIIITYPKKTSLLEAYKTVSSVMYVLGFYSINEENSKKNFLPFSWGYFTIIGLFSIRTYLVSKFNEIKNIYFIEWSKSEKSLEKDSKNIGGIKPNEISLIFDRDDSIINENNIRDIKHDKDDFNIPLNNYGRFKINNKKRKQNVEGEDNDIKNIKKKKLSYDISGMENYGKKEIFEESI